MPVQEQNSASEGGRGGFGSAASCIPADFTVALAGNANVGKSATLNQLTGAEQVTGNWPGKTVACAGGILLHDGYRIRITDLPGI